MKLLRYSAALLVGCMATSALFAMDTKNPSSDRKEPNTTSPKACEKTIIDLSNQIADKLTLRIQPSNDPLSIEFKILTSNSIKSPQSLYSTLNGYFQVSQKVHLINEEDLISDLNQLSLDTLKSDLQKQTVLHLAAAENNIDVIHLLQKCNSYQKLLMTKNFNNFLPFHVATYFGNLEAMTALFRKEDLENSAGPTWGTPLCIATGAGALEAVKFLLEKGAKVDAKGYAQRTSLFTAALLATDPKCQDEYDIFGRKKPKIDPSVYLAIMKELLKKGASFKKEDVADTLWYYLKIKNYTDADSLTLDQVKIKKTSCVIL